MQFSCFCERVFTEIRMCFHLGNQQQPIRVIGPDLFSITGVESKHILDPLWPSSLRSGSGGDKDEKHEHNLDPLPDAKAKQAGRPMRSEGRLEIGPRRPLFHTNLVPGDPPTAPLQFLSSPNLGFAYTASLEIETANSGLRLKVELAFFGLLAFGFLFFFRPCYLRRIFDHGLSSAQ